MSLQFDKDSDNSKIEVVQNKKNPQLSHIDAESSHDRRLVILSRLGPGRVVCEPNRLAFVFEVLVLGLNLAIYRVTDAADVLQSPACSQCRVARLFYFLILRQNHRLRSSQPKYNHTMLGCREKERKQDATRDNWRMRVECSDL